MANTRKDYVTWWKESVAHTLIKYPQYENYLKDYDFGVNQNQFSFGVCYSGAKKKIEISERICKDMKEEEVRDTLLHELAHAIDFAIRGTSNHDVEWKKVAVVLGANPMAKSKIVRGVEYKYVYVVEKFNGDLIFKNGVNKIDKRTELNKKLIGVFIQGQKNTTINKLKVITWEDWVYYCETNDHLPYNDYWYNKSGR